MVAVAFAVLPSDDDSADLQAAAPATTQTTVGTLTEPAPGGGMPALVAAATEDGRVVLVDVGTGTEVRELGRAPEGDTIDSVALQPGGENVLYGTCCDPVAGALKSVPTAGGAFEDLGTGYDPTFGPDPGSFARVELTGFVLQTDPPKTWTSAPTDGAYQDVAWSLDGNTAVLRESHGDPGVGTLLVFDTSGDSISEPRQLPGDQWAMPSFDKDGNLIACERTAPGTWAGKVLDVETGEVLDSWDYAGVPTDQDHDPTGEWFVAVVDGAIRYRAPDGTTGVIADGDFTVASW